MLIIAIVAAALAALIVIDAVRVYRKTPGASIMTAFHHSATIALTRLGSLGSLIVAAIVSLSSYLGDPNISGAVQTALGSLNPALVPFIPVVILVLAEFARRRTLNKD